MAMLNVKILTRMKIKKRKKERNNNIKKKQK